MKIIAGLYKGFSLKTFSGNDIRPTPGKVREALFDILGFKVVEADFLDVFAGTGAIGIEAFSRGAKRVTFIDNNKKGIKIIQDNLKKINKVDSYEILNIDFLKAIKNMDMQNNKFDIIFLDPPYNKQYVEKSLLAFDKTILLKKDSLLIVQHDIHEKAQINLQNLFFVKEKKYGKSLLSIFKS